MSVSITFHGAAKTVTGSNFLIEYKDTRFLIDCGMYQGPDVEARNLEKFDYDPVDIDFVLLTHAHLDHLGLLPKLTRHGFDSRIYCTMHTAQIAEIVMLDSAKIQEANYREGIPWKHAGVVDMIYDMRDAEKTVSQLEIIEMNEEFEPVPGIKVKYVKAGHILGAASIELEIEGKRIVFSGDIGREKNTLIGSFDPEHKLEADYVIMESLYGGEFHPERAESVNEMVQIMNETFERGGSVFIPSFAVQRTQEILHDIKLAKRAGAIKAEVQVWLDSPMAQRVTRIYGAALDHSEDSHFQFPGLHYVQNFKQSQKMSRRQGQIVIAGSGMADGGRIMGHLAANLADPKNTVLFVGYQAEATLGRELVEGVKEVEIDGRHVPVRARIYHLQGFSAHGDTHDYKTWLSRYNSDRLKQTFLIHAEEERAEALKEVFEQNNLDHPVIPDWKETVVLE